VNANVKPVLFLLAASAALAGCNTVIDPTVGQGPIALSAQTEKAFAEYQARQTPRYFAVSTDGRAYYYSYCDAGRCIRQPKTNVIDQCERYSNGSPCKIYGSQGAVVWATDN
jgi:hypothetical protein